MIHHSGSLQDEIEEQTSEEDDEHGEEIDASMEVLPTEEQLPGMQAAGRRYLPRDEHVSGVLVPLALC